MPPPGGGGGLPGDGLWGAPCPTGGGALPYGAVACVQFGGFAWISDIAVDPELSHLVVLGSDPLGASTVVVIDRATGTILRSVPTIAYGHSIGMVGRLEAIITDGYSGTNHIDLRTGVTTLVTGLDELMMRTPAYLDGAGASDGGDGVIATVECEPNAGSPLEIWGGTDTDRVLLASVGLAEDAVVFDGAVYIMSLAYAPDRDLVYTKNGPNLRAISTLDGSDVPVALTPPPDFMALAYDGANGSLLFEVQDPAGGATWNVYELTL
jgi:hypothetical protein